MLKYERIKYDKTAILKDDKELTKIDPFVLEDSFLYHIDAVTREVSIIWEPTICWETYGELTKNKEDKLESDDIQYFDVDDIDGQEIQEKKLVLDDTDKEELETSSLVEEIIPSAYAADLILDEIDEENNQALDEDAYLQFGGKYRYWKGDFVIRFNKDIDAFNQSGPDNCVILAGEYGDWGWLKFPVNAAVKAGEEVRLLESALNSSVSISYEELCTSVKNFNCGAVYLKDSYDAADPLIMTIEFRMYETYSPEEAQKKGFGYTTEIETGNYLVVDTYSYTY